MQTLKGWNHGQIVDQSPLLVCCSSHKPLTSHAWTFCQRNHHCTQNIQRQWVTSHKAWMSLKWFPPKMVVRNKWQVLNHNSQSCKYLHVHKTWGSGPLLCMACSSPVRFNWFLCTITEKFGVSTLVEISMDTLVFLCCFQLPKQENLHKPFEWHSKINTAHTHTSLFTLSPYN